MTLLQRLEAASFGGAIFFIDAAKTSGGRKTVTHEFVNSNNRNVEDLGKLLRTYKIVGFISGDSYIEDRNALIRALERKGRYILQHPFYGRVSVVAMPYKLDEDLAKLGVAKFSMEFEAATDVSRPVPQVGNAGTVTNASTEMNEKLRKDVEENFETPDVSTFKRAQAFVEGITKEFESVTELFAPAIDEVTQFSADLESFGDSVVELISAPDELATEITDLFDGINTIILTDLTQGLNALSSFFDFNLDSFNIFRNVSIGGAGNSISESSATATVNEQVLTRQMRITSLSMAYQTMSRIEFSNLDALDAEQARLEAQYQAVIIDPNMSSDTLELLKTLRDDVEVFFQNERLTINQVISLRVKRAPAQVLTYFLYGDLELYQEIVDLNADPDVSHYQGDIKALTQ